MRLLGGSADSDRTALARVRRWTEDWIADDRVLVRVTELACSKPGCPPRETVIVLLPSYGSTRQVKLHKPVVEISREELEAALAADEPPCC